MADEGRLVELDDGGELYVVEHGSGYPVMLLHGGPGLDHHEFRPWLDPLGDMGLRLIYVDERGQGCSPRVDPATLSVRGFAQDIDRLAQAMELGDYAVLGHSFGGSSRSGMRSSAARPATTSSPRASPRARR